MYGYPLLNGLVKWVKRRHAFMLASFTIFLSHRDILALVMQFGTMLVTLFFIRVYHHGTGNSHSVLSSDRFCAFSTAISD
jgi:hypothetical protein